VPAQHGSGALDSALDALRRRDVSAHELRQRLERRAFTAAECEAALATLERTGILDDRRFAEGRARSLAGHGAGDALVRHSLEEAGVAAELIDDALNELAPEAIRAQEIADRRGPGPKTARYLHGKGFSDETVAAVVATTNREELG
jgi:regulatory protein